MTSAEIQKMNDTAVEIVCVYGITRYYALRRLDGTYRFVGWNPEKLSNSATFTCEKDARSFAEAHGLVVNNHIQKQWV